MEESAAVMQGAQGMLVQNWPTVSSAAGEFTHGVLTVFTQWERDSCNKLICCEEHGLFTDDTRKNWLAHSYTHLTRLQTTLNGF